MEFFVTSDQKFEKSLVPILDKLQAHMKRLDRINFRPVKKPRVTRKMKLDQAHVLDSGSVTTALREAGK